MSDKTNFLLKYGKDGVHYDYEHEFKKALDHTSISRGVYEHPKFSEKHLDQFIDSNQPLGKISTYRILKHTRDNGMLKQRHIEKFFDFHKSVVDRQDIINLPGSELSPKIGQWAFDNGNIYDKTRAVRSHTSVARKVLDDIAASNHPDFIHPNSVWQEAIQNKDAVTPNDLEIAKKSGHSMIRYIASIQ